MAQETSIAIQGIAPAPGMSAKATVAAGGSSTAVQFRPAPAANANNVPVLITMTSVTTTAAGAGFANAYHVVFGDASVVAATATDMPIQDIDGWITLQVPASATHFRITSEATGAAGSVYVYIIG